MRVGRASAEAHDPRLLERPGRTRRGAQHRAMHARHGGPWAGGVRTRRAGGLSREGGSGVPRRDECGDRARPARSGRSGGSGAGTGGEGRILRRPSHRRAGAVAGHPAGHWGSANAPAPLRVPAQPRARGGDAPG
eukprot:4059359-Pleurochrysis_carterae.AAC.1